MKFAVSEKDQFMEETTPMNQYELPSPEKKPEYVKSNFDHIAKAYDRFNDWNSFFLHRSWKNWMVRQAVKESENPKYVVDLCCGTGDITARLSRVKSFE